MGKGHTGHSDGPWERLDASAFGLIYGSVTVLALLMAIRAHPESAIAFAAVLFGSVLAITLGKAFGMGAFETAVVIAQVYCIGLLMLVGGRVGWRLDNAWLSALLGAVFAGAIGLALALLKYVIH